MQRITKATDSQEEVAAEVAAILAEACSNDLPDHSSHLHLGGAQAQVFANRHSLIHHSSS